MPNVPGIPYTGKVLSVLSVCSSKTFYKSIMTTNWQVAQQTLWLVTAGKPQADGCNSNRSSVPLSVSDSASTIAGFPLSGLQRTINTLSANMLLTCQNIHCASSPFTVHCSDLPADMASSTFCGCLSRHGTTTSRRPALLNTDSAWLLLSLEEQHNMRHIKDIIFVWIITDNGSKSVAKRSCDYKMS